ncbi:MAG: ATP-binding protein [Methermicoccaceae archaeon]
MNTEENRMISIAITGKGGTGKTAISAMLVRYFTEQRKVVLAIDADPDANLSDTLGVDAERSVGDMREYILKGRDSLPPDADKGVIFESKIYEVLHEEDDYDLLVMGRSDGPGCYCYVNDLLRSIMDRILNNYDVVIIDTAAGLEHISRELIRGIDHVVVVADASQRGLKTALRIRELIDELETNIGALHLVLNKITSENRDSLMKTVSEMGIDVVGEIPYDAELAKLDLMGLPIQNGSLGAYKAAIKLAKRLEEGVI